MREELSDLVAAVRGALAAAQAMGAIYDEPRGLAASSNAEPPEGPVVAASLADVRAGLGECTRCSLCQGRSQIVFGVGDPHADLLIVGEAPGEQEDLRGEPFVGAAGEMLDRMLENVLGLARSSVYICNVIKCRPPKNRAPLPEEIATCRPFLEAQIAAVAPKVMLVLGGVAYKALFETDEGITRARGHWRDWQSIPTLPTFHPAYLLRQPADKRLVFADLQAVRVRYDALGGRRL